MFPCDPSLTRRCFLAGLAKASLGVMLTTSGLATPAKAQSEPAATAPVINDDSIYMFLLNLEYLEAAYHIIGTTGQRITPENIEATPGPVTGGRMVSFKNDILHQFCKEVANNKLSHTRHYLTVLNSKASPLPAVDLAAGFIALGRAAGLGDIFDPFGNEFHFLLGGMILEEVTITGYQGIMPLIRDEEKRGETAGILAVEAYHIGMARSQLYEAGETMQQTANAITLVRGEMNGMPRLEQGIETSGRANFVPADGRGIAFARSPQQVLQIMYVTPEMGVTSGGFFPQGVTGEIVST